MILPWQHIGNKKSDSSYPMENTDNQNNLCQNTHTKLFKSNYAGASGSDAKLTAYKLVEPGITKLE